jgi:YidC/Oxa1 family membrane protein insertase
MGETEKRLVLFLVLSVAIVYLFTVFGPSPPPKTPPAAPPATTASQNTAAPSTATSPATEATTASATDAAAPQSAHAPTPPQVITIDTPLYRAEVATTGGVLRRWELKRYTETAGGNDPVVLYPPVDLEPARAPLALVIQGIDPALLDRAVYRVEGGNAQLSSEQPSARLRLVAELAPPDGPPMRIEKELLFHEETYRVDLAVRVDGINAPYQLTLGDSFGIHLGQAQWQQSFIGHRGAVSLINDELILDKQPDKLPTAPVIHAGDVRWTALEGKYFIAALIPRMAAGEAVAVRQGDYGVTTGLSFPPAQRHELALYAGPKAYNRLAALQVGLERTIDFGWFMFWSLTLVQLIAKPLFLFLQFVHGYTHNYGVAIILVTVLIKLLFVPLTHKSYTSMKAMQMLQPKMAELQKKYKDDKERLNKEMFLLYKTYKVNPLGGCLPMLLQVPVFVAFFNILYTTIELRHAPFMLWIRDLSSQDPYYVLPIIMGATMFIQQKIQPSAMDPRQARIMMMLPVIFTFFFLTFPAGLVLYWLFNNLLTILQQYVTMKLQPAPAATSSS